MFLTESCLERKASYDMKARLLGIAVVLTGVLLLGGCGQSSQDLSGVYLYTTSDNYVHQVTIDGTIMTEMNVCGESIEYTIKIDGKKLEIEAPSGFSSTCEAPLLEADSEATYKLSNGVLTLNGINNVTMYSSDTPEGQELQAKIAFQ